LPGFALGGVGVECDVDRSFLRRLIADIERAADLDE